MSIRVIVGGAPRSGTTWMFNAARLLAETDGAGVHAAWWREYDPKAHVRWHIVKTHDPDHVKDSDIVLSVKRNANQAAQSWVRMGWAVDEAVAHADVARVQPRWTKLADYEAQYDDVIAAPAVCLANVAQAMGIKVDAAQIRDILAIMGAMRPPSEQEGRDPVTLLHPGHRADG